MMSVLKCLSCKNPLESSWIACPNCGTSVQENMINCVRCYHLIPLGSKFCTTCSYDQGISPIGKTKESKFKIRKIEVYENQETMVTKSLLTTSLKFDSNATGQIVSSSKFTRTALLITILAGISLAITIQSVGAVFGSESNLRNSIRLFIIISGIQIFTLIWVSLFTNMQFKAIGVPTTFNMNLRYFGIWGLVLILKDIFMYPTMLYIVIFEGESGFDMAIGVYITISSLVIAFLVIHAINYYRFITGYGLGINVLFFIMTLILSYMMVVYTVETLLAIVDMI